MMASKAADSLLLLSMESLMINLMFVLGYLCHSYHAAATPNRESTTPHGEHIVMNEDSMADDINFGEDTPQDAVIPHHHVSVAIIGGAIGVIFAILLIAWLIYAKQFPTSKSGQVLVRIRYTLQKRQPELQAYHSVQNCPDNARPV